MLPSTDVHTNAGGNKRRVEESSPPSMNTKKVKVFDGQDEDMSSIPFSTEVPRQHLRNRCVFGNLQTQVPWMIKTSDLASSPWSSYFVLDLGPHGMPALSLQIETDKKLHNGQALGLVSLKWYAHAYDHNSSLPVGAFGYEHFDDWYVKLADRLRTIPAIAEAHSAKSRDIMVVECNVQSPISENFNNSTLWNTIPEVVSKRLQEIFAANSRLTFLVFKTQIGYRRVALPLFARHVKEALGMLWQYKDAETKEYNLYKIEDIKTVEETGGGMYVGDKGSIYELPHLYKFPFPIQFRVYAAVTPIRQAQAKSCEPRHLQKYQEELDAVNEFCTNTSGHTPSINLHRLLMDGGHSNPLDTFVDVYGAEDENIKIFEEAVSIADTMLNDEKQVQFIKRLKKVHNNTLALAGPPATGKSTLLAFVAVLLALLGHKVLLFNVQSQQCGHDLRKFMRALHVVEPSRLYRKRIFCMKSSDNIEEILPDYHTDTHLDMTMRDCPQRLIPGRSEHTHSMKTTIESRLCSDLDILVLDYDIESIANIIEHGFKPSAILIDDAQCLYHASLFLILTQLPSWQALILAGNHREVGDPLATNRASEVLRNSEISTIELLNEGTKNHTLDTQYRLLPQIANFPMACFHDDVNCHWTTDSDNFNRRAFRAVSDAYLWSHAVGSNYFFLDMGRSVSSKNEFSGHTNINNAKAIELLVLRLINQRVLAEDITICCLLIGQMRLISDLLRSNKDRRMKIVGVYTIERFSRQDNSIVIVDLVRAYDLDFDNPGVFRKASVDPSEPCHVTLSPSHIPDGRLLYTALTRARDGLVVVGQIPLLVAKVWVAAGRLGNASFYLADNALQRKLVHSSEDFDNEKLGAAGPVQRQAAEAERRRYWSFVNSRISINSKFLNDSLKT